MNKQELIRIVKLKLWRFTYSVKDFSEIEHINFDLLVEAKFRVNVGDKNIQEMPENCDIYAFVDNQGVVIFTRQENGQLLDSTSPYPAFGKHTN